MAGFGMLLVTFSPPGILAKELDLLSLKRFRAEQAATAERLREIRKVLQPGDVIAALNDSPVSARVLEYEFPEHVVLGPATALGAEPVQGWLFYRKRQQPLGPGYLPDQGRLHVLVAPGSLQREDAIRRLCDSSPCETGEWRVTRLR